MPCSELKSVLASGSRITMGSADPKGQRIAQSLAFVIVLRM